MHGLRRAGQDLPGALPAAAAGPHLRAQRSRPPAGGAAAQALVAPVRPRAAGRGDPPVRTVMNRAGSTATDITPARERRGVLPARVRRHRRRAARGAARDLHPVRGQGRPAAARRRCSRPRGAACRSTSPSTAAARPTCRTTSSARCTDAGVRLHVFDPAHAPARLAHQRVPPHAPQDRGGRRRASPSSAASTTRPTTWPTSARGQAGLRGRDRRARWWPRSIASPTLRWPQGQRYQRGASWWRGRSSLRSSRTACRARARPQAHVRHARQPATTSTTSSGTTAPRSARRASA